MKKLLSLQAWLVIATLFSNVYSYDAPENPREITLNKPLIYGHNSTIGFELDNKSGPIWIALINGSKVIFSDKKVEGYSPVRQSDTVQAEIDTAKETILGIWLKKPINPTVSKGWFGLGKQTINPTPDFIYTFAPGTTLYITFNEDLTLAPTKAELKGSNKTASGLSLGNNIVFNVTSQSSCALPQ